MQIQLPQTKICQKGEKQYSNVHFATCFFASEMNNRIAGMIGTTKFNIDAKIKLVRLNFHVYYIVSSIYIIM